MIYSHDYLSHRRPRYIGEFESGQRAGRLRCPEIGCYIEPTEQAVLSTKVVEKYSIAYLGAVAIEVLPPGTGSEQSPGDAQCLRLSFIMSGRTSCIDRRPRTSYSRIVGCLDPGLPGFLRVGGAVRPLHGRSSVLFSAVG